VTTSTVSVSLTGPESVIGNSLETAVRLLKPGTVVLTDKGDLCILTSRLDWTVLAAQQSSKWSAGAVLAGIQDRVQTVVHHLHITAEAPR
jgi:hypothetical protein